MLFFCNGGEEITAQAVNDVKHRGVETSGSTARSDVRERSEGNPSPTTISKTMHLSRGAFFFAMGEEITAQAVNDAKHRGVETSGSTAAIYQRPLLNSVSKK